MGVDWAMAAHGQRDRDSAIRALAARLRRGERLHLLCHCTPGPCHATPLAQEVTAAVRRGDGEGTGDDVFTQWMTVVHNGD